MTTANEQMAVEVAGVLLTQATRQHLQLLQKSSSATELL